MREGIGTAEPLRTITLRCAFVSDKNNAWGSVFHLSNEPLRHERYAMHRIENARIAPAHSPVHSHTVSYVRRFA